MQIYISIVARDIINLSIGKLGSKESTCNAGDMGSIPGLGRSSGEGNGNAVQYPCLGNPMDRGAWGAIQSMRSQESDMT